MNKNKGFTIIELLIVISVIAILIGIALPRFKGMQDEGKIAQAKGELRTLQAAVESYYIHHNNSYPGAIVVLSTAIPNVIGSIPKDPFIETEDDSDYGYEVNASTPTRYYVIYSAGPNTNGSATISSSGVITETYGESCIYVTNASKRDTQP